MNDLSSDCLKLAEALSNGQRGKHTMHDGYMQSLYGSEVKLIVAALLAYHDVLYPIKPGGFATTAELAKEFGATDAEADQIQTRVEKLAGNDPQLVP